MFGKRSRLLLSMWTKVMFISSVHWPLTSQGHPKWSQWALYVTSIASNIVTLILLHVFHIKNCDFGFWSLKVIQGQIWLCQSKAHGCFQKKSSLSYVSPFSRYSNQMIVTLTFNLSRSSKVKTMGTLYNLRWVQHRNACRSWHISRQKVWPWFLTPQGHPRSNLTVPIESPWVLHISASWRSNLVSITVWDISSQTILTLTFDPLRVIQGQILWCQPKAHGHFRIWPLLSPTPYLSPFGHKSPVWPPTHPTNQPPNQRHSYNVCIAILCIAAWI